MLYNRDRAGAANKRLHISDVTGIFATLKLAVNWLKQASKLPLSHVLFEVYPVIFQIVKNARMRRLCSGKTLAFQAKDAGSIPARRSNYTHKRSQGRYTSICFYLKYPTQDGSETICLPAACYPNQSNGCYLQSNQLSI